MANSLLLSIRIYWYSPNRLLIANIINMPFVKNLDKYSFPKLKSAIGGFLYVMPSLSQIPRSKLTGHQTCNAAELRGIRPSRQSPNGCASTSARLVARGNKQSNRLYSALFNGLSNIKSTLDT